MIVVTHEIGFARDVSRKGSFFLHEGLIEVEGPPQKMFENPGKVAAIPNNFCRMRCIRWGFA
ncbi:MAG: hypothetical protein Ct9H300mP16_06110 [Pseudomonadota bacterium]|nr:MAG: hypothetical protein Ct9H300mP16_06110 [Pseudomonadota bacterium]